MAVRKTPQKIKEEILEFLFEGPQSISEIANKIKSNWPTTNKYLEELKGDGKVNEILSTDKMKVYRRTDDPVYYSLPFSKDIRIKTLYILREIQKKWKEERGDDLSKTALQKIAVDVIKECDLDLPILEFHYGMTTCASFDPNNQEINRFIQEPKDKVIILKCIGNVVADKKNHTGIAYKERLSQYKRYKMPFYLAKEELTKLFILNSNKKSNKEFKDKLQKAILQLSLNYPIRLEKSYPDFERFVNAVQIILAGENDEESNQLEIIKGTLVQLWDKLTTFTSFNDSEKFIERNRKQLFDQIRDMNYNFKEMDYACYLEELESLAQEVNPFKIKMPESDESKEIQGLIIEGLENE